MKKHPWIPVAPDGAAPRDLQTMYDEVRDPRGQVDNILSIHSLRPASLRPHLGMYRARWWGPGTYRACSAR